MSSRKRAIIAVAALLAGLGLAEAVVRVFARERVDTEILRANLNFVSLGGLMQPSVDPERYYELRPNHDTTFKGRRVRIGPDGFLAASEEPAAGAWRVAVVGGSSTFEFGVGPDRIWPALFCRGLEAEVGREIRLKNFSVPGYVATQQASVLLGEVMAWGPDLVLWHYDHRDAYPVLIDATPVQLAPEVGDNPLRSAAWKLVVRAWRTRSLERMRFRGEETALFENYITAGPWYERHVDAILRADAGARDRDVPVLFVVYDTFMRTGPAGRAHHGRLHEPLLSWLRPTSFRVVDLFEPLQRAMEDRGEADQRSFWLSREPLDAHPNETAHEYVALAVLREVTGDAAWLAKIEGRALARLAPAANAGTTSLLPTPSAAPAPVLQNTR